MGTASHAPMHLSPGPLARLQLDTLQPYESPLRCQKFPEWFSFNLFFCPVYDPTLPCAATPTSSLRSASLRLPSQPRSRRSPRSRPCSQPSRKATSGTSIRNTTVPKQLSCQHCRYDIGMKKTQHRLDCFPTRLQNTRSQLPVQQECTHLHHLGTQPCPVLHR